MRLIGLAIVLAVWLLAPPGRPGAAYREEGRNLSIEFRNAEGHPGRFPELMSDLVRLNVDVLLSLGPEASLQAARNAELRIGVPSFLKRERR
jgi:hypothetical protein